MREKSKKVRFLYFQCFINTSISKEVVIRDLWLENRNVNITTQLACLIKTFEDCRLVQQIREEIEKVRPCIAVLAS